MPAQTFTVLHVFSAASDYTNDDGSFPYSNFILMGNTLYGTAVSGGTSGKGALFSVSTSGTHFATLHAFTDFDGRSPQTELIGSGTPFYGATPFGGGSMAGGTVFKVNADGTDFTLLHTFIVTNVEGAYPRRLLLSGNSLYGVTLDQDLGGGVGSGTIFRLNTDGTGFTTLYRFRDDGDGALPTELLLSEGTLYGAAEGSTSHGTVFKINIDGTGFQVLHSFATEVESPTNSNGYPTNTDGSIPGRLTLSGNTLYGTTWGGGIGGNGTLFTMNTDGTDFRVLHVFAPWAVPAYPQVAATNSDGAAPDSLVLFGNQVFGATSSGGARGGGTVFAVNTNGDAFEVLHQFVVTSADQNGIYTNSEGASPSGLLLSDYRLYGSASEGGAGGSGTIFSISLPIGPPPLAITAAGSNVVLSWPTNSTGFVLQSTTNLVSPFWVTNGRPPFVVNGHYSTLEPIDGHHRFYRLSH